MFFERELFAGNVMMLGRGHSSFRFRFLLFKLNAEIRGREICYNLAMPDISQAVVIV
jgi:hypothetical protein